MSRIFMCGKKINNFYKQNDCVAYNYINNLKIYLDKYSEIHMQYFKTATSLESIIQLTISV
jgi:hypothetical protein